MSQQLSDLFPQLLLFPPPGWNQTDSALRLQTRICCSHCNKLLLLDSVSGRDPSNGTLPGILSCWTLCGILSSPGLHPWGVEVGGGRTAELEETHTVSHLLGCSALWESSSVLVLSLNAACEAACANGSSLRVEMRFISAKTETLKTTGGAPFVSIIAFSDVRSF